MADLEPKEIRECFAEYRDAWKEIRDEAAIDMRFILGDPWDPEDREQRKGSGRPCISLDEINQYLNQYLNNSLRQNKRSVQVMAKGDGANDQDALKRSNLIMGIEEKSNAQLAYINAGQSAAERSYGFAVIRTECPNNDIPDEGEIDPSIFDQELVIKPILNPDTVLISPAYKKPDASDIEDGFVLDLIRKKSFRTKYKGARVTDFTEEDLKDEGLTDWVKENYVQVGEFWKIHYTPKKVLLIGLPEGGIQVFREEDWKKAKAAGAQGEMKRERMIEAPSVFQYLTNGLEILDKVPWDGTRVPIISCFGKELWTTEGGSAKRHLLSMIRLARDPQMLFAYLASGECEEAGQIPKSPFVGAKGQFESDKDTWDELTKIPHAYAQYDIVLDDNGTPLPAPQRGVWTPNFQEWEAAKDSARRSIQAAMGSTPLPTAAQRANEKSGIALDKIQTMESVGSFHFADNYRNFLHNMGWQLNELITPILDTPRQMPVTSPDGTRTTMHIVGNTSHPIDDQGVYEVAGLPSDHLHTGKGEFDVTISDGPNFQSEREEQSAFVDTILANLPNLPIPPEVAQKVLALAIKMKDLGAIGDQIATLLNPPDPNNLTPEAQAIVAQLQAQLAAATQESSALHMERAGKVLEQQTKILLQQMKNDNAQALQQLKNDIQVLLGEISTKAQNEQQRNQLYQDFMIENHRAAHDAALQAADQQHQRAQSAQAQQAAALQQQQVTPTPESPQPGATPPSAGQ